MDTADLQAMLTASCFGSGPSHDRVWMENASFAALRLSLKGARSVIITDSAQLHGFMVRRKVAGHVSAPRMSSYFSMMTAPLLTEYAKECCLFAGTLAEGGVLYVPYGAILGERTMGLALGVRWGCIMKQPSDPHITDKTAHKLEELSKHVPGMSDAMQARRAAELSVSKALATLMAPVMAPVLAAVAPAGGPEL